MTRTLHLNVGEEMGHCSRRRRQRDRAGTGQGREIEAGVLSATCFATVLDFSLSAVYGTCAVQPVRSEGLT